jgi:hypothetical protein
LAFKDAKKAWQYATDVIKHFMYTVRYLDDLLSIGNTYLHKLFDLAKSQNHTVGATSLDIHGIYPCSVGGLEITIEHASPDSSIYNHFMDVAFHRDFQADKKNSQIITTSVYNKRHHTLQMLPAHTYTHIDSDCPFACKLNTMSSRIKSAARLSRTRFDLFIPACMDVYDSMLRSGHNKRDMWTMILKCNRCISETFAIPASTFHTAMLNTLSDPELFVIAGYL